MGRVLSRLILEWSCFVESISPLEWLKACNYPFTG